VLCPAQRSRAVSALLPGRMWALARRVRAASADLATSSASGWRHTRQTACGADGRRPRAAHARKRSHALRGRHDHAGVPSRAHACVCASRAHARANRTHARGTPMHQRVAARFGGRRTWHVDLARVGLAADIAGAGAKAARPHVLLNPQIAELHSHRARRVPRGRLQCLYAPQAHSARSAHRQLTCTPPCV